MELSSEISKGLTLLGDPKQIPDNAFKPLVEFSVAILYKKATEAMLQEHAILGKLDPILVKEVFGSITSFFLEAAKLNSDSEVLKSKLEELSVDSRRIELIIQIYVERKKGLRDLLASTGFGWPHVVGVEWRLDYYIKSNTIEKVDAPLFYISLKNKVNRELTEEENEKEKENDKQNSTGKGFKDVSFTCTAEQLQDLVSKLRDAVKQVERSSTLQQ